MISMKCGIGSVLFALVFGSSCLIPGAGFKPTSPDPVLWIDSIQHDFGTVSGQETVEHVFTVRNTGAQELNIQRVQTSCGCTAAVLGNQILKPNEATPLKITFDPRGRKGRQARMVWIYSNDPKSPRKQVIVIAAIEPPQPALPDSSATPPGAERPALAPAP
jgi:hypothetical protein